MSKIKGLIPEVEVNDRRFPDTIPVFVTEPDGSNPRKCNGIQGDEIAITGVLDGEGKNGWVQIAIVLGDAGLFSGLTPDQADRFADALKATAEDVRNPKTDNYFTPEDVKELEEAE